MKARALRTANWGIVLAALLALFAIVNYLSFRHYKRWDLTASSSYSISQQTKKVIEGLKEPLDVVVFLAPNDELFEKVKNLLSAYVEAGKGKVRVEYIDPDRQKARMEELAKRYSVGVANVVVFSSGSRSKYVEKDQMVDYDFSGYQYGGPPKVKDFKAEEAFTNAILDVLNPVKPVIYFTAGHGERSAQGQRGQTIDTFRERLGHEGAELKELQTLGKDSVPAGASLVVVAGPQYPFTPPEAAILDKYLASGGRMLVFADPLLSQGKSPSFVPSGLESLLAKWGVTLEDAIAIDPEAAVPLLGAQTFYAVDLSNHPVTKDLAGNQLPILFALARPLGLGTPQDAAYKAEYLARSSAKAWGERDLTHLDAVQKDPKDVPGPLTLAAAVSSDKKDKGTRLVVVGNSEIVADGLIQSGPGNLLFCLNAAHWLLNQEARLAIPPKTAIETHLSLTGSQANFIFISLTFILPALVVALGLYVFLKRRR